MLNQTKSILALMPVLALLLAAPAHAQHDYRNANGWVDFRGTGFLVGPDLFMTADHLGDLKGVTVFFDTWKDGVQQEGWYRAIIGDALWRGGGADIALWRVHETRDTSNAKMNRDIGDVIGFYEIDRRPTPAKGAAVLVGGGAHYQDLHGKVLWTNDKYIVHNAQGSPGFSGSPTFVDGRSEVAGVYTMTILGAEYSDRISYVWDDIKEFFEGPSSSVTAAISGPTGSVAGAFDVTITFSEPVAGFEASDINVTNGSVTKFAGAGASYTATIEPTSDGAVTVRVPANAAGNNRASKVYTVIVYSPSLERTLIGHTGSVSSVAYSPDGSHLASGGDNTIRIWNADTGALIRTLTGHTGSVSSVAYSPDGSYLASGGWDNTIRIWNADTGALIRTLTGHTRYVNSVAYSSDGSQLASGGGDRILRVWNAETGAPIRTLIGHHRDILSVAYSPDVFEPASGSGDNIIFSWNVRRGAPSIAFTGHTNTVFSVAYSPDGSHLASGSGDNTIRIWNAGTGAPIRTLTGHTKGVFSVAYSPDGSELVSGGGDNTIRIWNAGTGAPIRTFTGHTGSVSSVAYSPDGTRLASAGGDNTIRIWRLVAAPLTPVTATISGPSDSVTGAFDVTIIFSEAVTGFETADINVTNGSVTKFAGSGFFYTATIEPASEGAVTVSVPANAAGNNIASEVYTVIYSLATATISGPSDSVTGAFDVSITFSDAVTGFETADIDVTNGSVTKFAGSGSSYTATIEPASEGAVTVSVPANSAGNNIASEVYTVIYSSSLERTLIGHTSWVNSVAYSPDGSHLASGSGDNTIRIWNADTGAPIRTLTEHTGPVFSVAYSSDGSQLASGSLDKTIRIWNADTGALIRTLTGHTYSVHSAAYSLDGQLASGSDDRTLQVWNADTGAPIRTLTGHTNTVHSVAYSPDSSHLASGSLDKTIRIWNADTGAPIRTLTGHTNTVHSVAYSPDGSHLASGSVDNTIRIWNAGTGAHIRTLTGHTKGVFSAAYSSDGSQLASGGGDNTIRIWNAETGALIRTLTGHTNTVWSVAYSPDSARLASGSNDNTIRVWKLREAPITPITPITAAISGPSGSVKGAFDVSIAFSEPVAGFEASDINVTNGSVTNLAGSGATYTATIALSKPGAVTAVIPANAAGNNRASNIYTVEADLNTTFTISLKRGLNLIHVPVKDRRLSKVSDLYNALGGSSDVEYILSYIPSAAGAGVFAAYVGVPGSLGDAALSDQTAAIVGMRKAKKVSFTGGLLNDTVALRKGVNLIGVPRAESVEKASGVVPDASAVLVLIRDSLGNARFSLVVPNTRSDAAAVGGQGYIVVADADGSIKYTGEAWGDPEGPSIAADAVQLDPTSAPVFLVAAGWRN